MEEKQANQQHPASQTDQPTNGTQQAQPTRDAQGAGHADEVTLTQQPAADNGQLDADNAAAEAKALEEAHAKIAELHESFLRARAETENVRRRAQEDVAKTHKFAIESLAENLLPVIDSLEAALGDSSGDIAKVREGVELTLRQLMSALEKGRITQLNPVGEKFDPHQHQAISMVPADQEPNTVVTVLQKGYVIADRVLRPALVTVAAPK
jgi:molecular chaperone GrpE